MKQLSTKSLASQRGALYMTALMLVLVGGLLTCILKIAPLYMDNSTIVNSMEGVAAKDGYKTMGIGEIRKDMLRALQVNRIDGFDAENIKLAKEGNQEFVDINYESRVLIFGNLYATIDFKNRFNK